MSIRKLILDNMKLLNYNKKYERSYLAINYTRLMPAVIFLYAVEWIIFVISDNFMGVGDVIFWFQIFVTFVIPVLLFFRIKFDHIPFFCLKAAQYIYLSGALVFGAFLVFETQNQADYAT